MGASLRNSAASAAVLVCVVLGGASRLVGQASPDPATDQQQPLLLEGIVFDGDTTLDSGTVVLHRVNPDMPDRSGDVEEIVVGPGGEFQFAFPPLPPDLPGDGYFLVGDVYFASVEYDGVLYFGSGITGSDQLDSVYVVQVFPAQEVRPGDAPLDLEQRAVFIEFAGEDWFATDLLVLANEGSRTFVAPEGGVVWSYPLPPGASEPLLGQGSDLAPDAVTFEGGRVLVSSPIPPGGSGFMIRYRLEELESTIPAPGRTHLLQVLIREPSPPIRVVGLEPLGVEALETGTTWRLHGANDVTDVNLRVVRTEQQGPPPFEWLALFATAMLAVGGFLAYAHPRRRVLAVQGVGLGREALILEVARIDNELAEEVEPDAREALVERRAALLSVLRAAH